MLIDNITFKTRFNIYDIIKLFFFYFVIQYATLTIQNFYKFTLILY